MKILILEDDIVLNEVLDEYLSSLGYETTVVSDGSTAQDIIYNEVFDIIVSDVNVPNINGFDLLKEMRKSGIKTPTIFLTSRNTPADVQEGFDAGCDDYLKKPFELQELNLRINNIKRLYNISDELKFKVSNDIFYNFDEKYIMVLDKKVSLSKTESKVFEYFLKNDNRVISIDELSTNIWGYDNTPSFSTIRTYIKNIRKIIGVEFIENIKGFGYILKITKDK